MNRARPLTASLRFLLKEAQLDIRVPSLFFLRKALFGHAAEKMEKKKAKFLAVMDPLASVTNGPLLPSHTLH